MAAVLQLLNYEPRKTRGSQWRGGCPLHGSRSLRSRSFSVNLDEHVFHCFKCGCCGNALELWAKATGQTPYDAAVDLCSRLGIPLPRVAADPGTGKRNP